MNCVEILLLLAKGCQFLVAAVLVGVYLVCHRWTEEFVSEMSETVWAAAFRSGVRGLMATLVYSLSK